MTTASDILRAIDLGEDADWEFKSAKGGVPASLWDTYSAMANTNGGVIVLGVEEKRGAFRVVGLDDASRARKIVWDCANDRGRVSANMLTERDVAVLELEGMEVVVVRVPRAARRQRPVYAGQNPVKGTYRRNFEGDYRWGIDRRIEQVPFRPGPDLSRKQHYKNSLGNR
jgi:predicted HTH transcriptional regulator